MKTPALLSEGLCGFTELALCSPDTVVARDAHSQLSSLTCQSTSLEATANHRAEGLNGVYYLFPQ